MRCVPIACRRYCVVGEPRAPEEGCTVARAQDVVRLSPETLKAALVHTQPFYVVCGFWEGNADDVNVFFSGLSTEIRSVDWIKH